MRVIFWGSYDLGKPRNRILLDGLRRCGVDVIECHAPVWDGVEDKSLLTRRQRARYWLRLALAYPSLILRFLRAPRCDSVLVGYLGQIDVLVLWPFARLRRIPIVWDAYLSLYNTLVEDRQLCRPGHPLARLIYMTEWLDVRAADLITMDTGPHADYLARRFGIDRARVCVIPLGVEDSAFYPPAVPVIRDGPCHVLFYGQLAPLHGIDTILAAAKRCEGHDVHWKIIGHGQLTDRLRALFRELHPAGVTWQPWIAYEQLVHLIHRSDVCLGIFGNGIKAQLVVPNKVVQAVAAGCTVITADTPAMRERNWPAGAVKLVPAADADALAAAVIELSIRCQQRAAGPAFGTAMLDLGPATGGRLLSARMERLRRDTKRTQVRGKATPARGSNWREALLPASASLAQLLRDLSRPAVRAARQAHVRVVIGRARLFPRAGPFILRRIDGADPLAASGRAAIYAHYDPHGELHDYQVETLRALRDAGFRVILVSNTERLTPAAIAAAGPLVRELVIRRNIGYDFGAFQDVLHSHEDLSEAEQILLCNDSVYGPFVPLSPLLEKATPDQADVWGMTDGRNHGPHLQSYFLLFHRRAITSPAFGRFWRALPALDDKFAVVEAGELGLSRTLAAAGLRLRALFPYDEAEAGFRAAADASRPDHRVLLRALDRGRALNPTHHFWRVLIADMGLPFIKRELLALNPAGLRDTDDWQQVIAARFGVQPVAAHAHLTMLAKPPRSPRDTGLMRLLRTIMSAP